MLEVVGTGVGSNDGNLLDTKLGIVDGAVECNVDGPIEGNDDASVEGTWLGWVLETIEGFEDGTGEGFSVNDGKVPLPSFTLRNVSFSVWMIALDVALGSHGGEEADDKNEDTSTTAEEFDSDGDEF